MANVKFSDFDVKTSTADVAFIVGYNGTDNVRITSANFLGDYLPLAGGTMTGNTIHGTNVESRWGSSRIYNDGTNTNFLILSGDVSFNNFGQGDDISFTLTGPTGTSNNYFKLNGQDERIDVGVDMNFGQGDKAIFNNSLEIYATNTGASFIKDTEANNFLTIQSGADLKLQSSGGKDYIICNENTSVEIYYNDAKKLETTSTGINITGEVRVTGKYYDSTNVPGTNGQVLSSTGTGTAWIAAGGGGASSLNDLSDVLVDGTSAYFLNIPGSLSGNPADNLVIGDSAGNSLTTGNSNVFLGKNAGFAATGGQLCVMIGENAGLAHTTNPASVYIGVDAARSMNSSNTVAVGYRAIRNVGGAYNQHTVVGSQSCSNTTSGNWHTAFGYRTLFLQSSGIRNTVMGYQSLYSGTSFTDNTALGYEAGKDITGNQNTVVGSFAANSGTNDLTSGSNNILIGYDASASAATVNNEITLGNSSISTLRCAVTSITSLSDERDKSNIKDLSYGLDFINSLQPREFVWDNRAEIKLKQVKDENGDDVFDENNDIVFEEIEFYSDNKGKKDFGFIAQEVQSLDDDTLRLVYDKNPEKLEISYGKLVPILVKAIQELKAEIDILKS